MSQNEFYRLIGPVYLSSYYENFHVCMDCCNQNTRQKQLEEFMLARVLSLWSFAHVLGQNSMTAGLCVGVILHLADR